MRTDIRWNDHDPVAQLLAEIPRSQRSKIIRAILEAALLPGGWAKLVNGQLTVRGHTESQPTEPPSPASFPDAGPASESEVISPMNPASAQGFVAGLRQFLEEV